MSKELFTYREFRTRTIMYGCIPIFRNTLIMSTPNYLHHCSMYGVIKEEADLQMRLGNTKYREVVHYSDELVIDTDNEETAANVYTALKGYSLTFEMWRLNNFKFYLKRANNDSPSFKMCFQDRQFVRNAFNHCNSNNGLDVGIYASPFHLCRAKGAIHEITGKKSELCEVFIGENNVSTNHIELTKFEQPFHNIKYETNTTEWGKLQSVLAISDIPYSNRHNCFFGLGLDLRKYLTYDAAKEIVSIFSLSINYELEKALRAFDQGWIG